MESVPDTRNSLLEEINNDLTRDRKVRLFIKRDDLIHPDISGNKWRKLKYNLLQCQRQKSEGILTFGGAFSNHLVATAAACNLEGLKAVGVVRGEELTAESNETLKRCAELGMQLHFISREEYHLRDERYYHEELLEQFPNFYVVPEGGANYYGMIGCQELMNEIGAEVDQVVVAQGTTTTSCGLLLGMHGHQKMTVVPVMQGYDSKGEMRKLLGKTGIDMEEIDSMLEKVDPLISFHFGGYAKFDDGLIAFIRDFYDDFGIQLDPVYTGKAMYALFEMMRHGAFDGQKVVFVHTGGLQGIPGIEAKMGEKLFQ